MPELPEVEVVRRGLERWVVGRRIADVEVGNPRATRRHPAGSDHFAAVLKGRTPVAAHRRGKYLWLPLDGAAGAWADAPVGAPSHGRPDGPRDDLGDGADTLVAHLGMSGQLLVLPADAPDGPHLRARFRFDDGGSELRFVDQRTFGGLAVQPSVGGVPAGLVHIARDPLDPRFDEAGFAAAVRRRRTGVKRALLDQGLVSGIGNIYADEALWRARLHYARPTETLNRAELSRLLGAVREVMVEALAQGGTSFDALYVNVNGESGYFDRSLQVYGQEGQACARCGTPIRRDPFMNRSSYTCPRCQPRPRRARW